MPSAIDSSFIGIGNVSKTGMITALNTARDEISALQTAIVLPTNLSFGTAALFGLGYNPYMEVSQQFGASSSVAGAGTYSVDQVYTIENCATLTASFQQIADPHAGTGILARLRNGLRVTTTVAQAVLVAAESYQPYTQPIEGTAIRHLLWGTPSARGIVIIACVTASVTGTYTVAVRNGAANRSYVSTVALVAATPTMIYVPIPGDQTGTWPADTSAAMFVSIGAVTGVNLHAGALNVWGASNSFSHSSATNWGATVSSTFTVSYCNIFPENTLPITNAGELVGATLNTLLDIRRPYAEELVRCRRYFYIYTMNGVFSAYTAFAYTSWQITHPCEMRTAPTHTIILTGTNSNLTLADIDANTAANSRAVLRATAAGDAFTTNRTYSMYARM